MRANSSKTTHPTILYILLVALCKSPREWMSLPLLGRISSTSGPSSLPVASSLYSFSGCDDEIYLILTTLFLERQLKTKKWYYSKICLVTQYCMWKVRKPHVHGQSFCFLQKRPNEGQWGLVAGDL